MCGIAGFAASPGKTPPGRELLERMTASLEHRGPDAQDVWLERGVGLGHRRLAIIDVEGGRNPLFDAERRAVMVFNGEIYNHRELRAELKALGHEFRTGSDGEVVVHGYLAWGWLGTLRRLRGMYAIALCDTRDGSLHLARDPLGIKPLFWCHGPQGLLFGSEMKAIVEALPSTPSPSPRGLLQCITLGYTLAPQTIYAGIAQLEPGTCATWRDGRLEFARHHELVFEPGAEPDDPDLCWSQVTRTVKSHLMSEVPLGAFLSGGVDSSAVVTAMREVSEGDVDAVSVGVAGLDERMFAREVAENLGVTLHEEVAEPDIADLLPRLAWHLEMPFCDTSAAPTWLVCEAARRHVTVALSGDGGDENFAGYRRTRFDVLEESMRASIPEPLRKGLLGPMGRAWPRGTWVPKPLRAGTLLRNVGGDWLDGYVNSLARIPEETARALMRPELRPDEPLRAGFEAHAARVQHYDPLSRVLAMDFKTWLTDDILVKVDRTSMAHALEVRVPLLDTDFVEWAARLPAESKLEGGEGKRLFKRSLRGRVPDIALDRPKQGFHLPVGDWLRDALRPRLAEVLAHEDSGVFELLDHGRLKTLTERHWAGSHDHTTELWMLLTTDAWLRHGPGGSER